MQHRIDLDKVDREKPFNLRFETMFKSKADPI